MYTRGRQPMINRLGSVGGCGGPVSNIGGSVSRHRGNGGAIFTSSDVTFGGLQV